MRHPSPLSPIALAVVTAALTTAARPSQRAQPSSGAVVGTVRDAEGRPLAGATVWVDDRAPTPVSGDSAAFALRDVSPGPHGLHGRAIGRSPLDTTVVVAERAEIERRSASRFGDLLRGLPGVTLFQRINECGATEFAYVMRGTATVKGELCPIAYFVDGQPAAVAMGAIDNLVRPADLDSIEVYTSGSQAPARFNTTRSGRCGVIVLWTRGR